jgi:4-hydroxybenzoate decarboxylase subunit C
MIKPLGDKKQMHKDLRSFLTTLRNEKDIVEISAPVDAKLELAEIHRRVIEEGGPALLFTNVKGSNFPVVTNLFGTVRRVEQAFGPRPERLVRNLIGAMDKLLPPKFSSLWQHRAPLLDIARTGMKTIQRSKAPVADVVEDHVDLHKLPVLTSWQLDGGPFFTLPLVYTEHPITKEHNLGMYRMQVQEKNRTGIHWQIQKGGGFHHHEAELRDQALPVTVFLGGPPALITTAIAPLPEAVPELLFTSFLMGEKLEVTDVSDHAHRLISKAEFAFCGEVPAHVRHPEGPFGDHYGYYSWEHDFPIFNIKKMFRRKDAIYPATVVGKPRQEDYFIGDYLQSLLSPMFPVVMPGVKSLWTYGETGFHSLAGAVVRESYYREAMAHAFRIMGEGQLTLTKFLMLTDVPCDLGNFPELLEIVLERFNPQRDLLIVHDTSMDTLDYTGRKFNHGSKAIMLGIGEKVRDLPREYKGGPIPGISKTKPYCGGCLVMSGGTYSADEGLPNRLIEAAQERLQEWPLVFLVDNTDDITDQTTFLWTTFTRFDPAHDVYAKKSIRQNKLQFEGPIVIDARMKPFYPDELVPREDIVQLVDRRWKEYFPS